MEANGKTKDDVPPVDSGLSKRELECQKLKLQVEEMQVKIDLRRGQLVEKQEIKDWFIPALSVVRTELLSIPGKLAAQVSGMEPPAAEAAIRDSINLALHHIQNHPWE